MNSILEALYNNKLSPSAGQTPKDPKYAELGLKLDAMLVEWKAKLSDDEYEKIIELLDLHGEIHEMDTAASFAYGFTLGASIQIEVEQRRNELNRPSGRLD